MSFSSTPKTAFLYFGQWFSNRGGEFISKSPGAVSNSSTDGFVIEGKYVGSWGD